MTPTKLVAGPAPAALGFAISLPLLPPSPLRLSPDEIGRNLRQIGCSERQEEELYHLLRSSSCDEPELGRRSTPRPPRPPNTMSSSIDLNRSTSCCCCRSVRSDFTSTGFRSWSFLAISTPSFLTIEQDLRLRPSRSLIANRLTDLHRLATVISAVYIGEIHG